MLPRIDDGGFPCPHKGRVLLQVSPLCEIPFALSCVVLIKRGRVMLAERLCSIPWMVLLCKCSKHGCGVDSPRGQIFLHSL
jgi:hypothetical protein